MHAHLQQASLLTSSRSSLLTSSRPPFSPPAGPPFSPPAGLPSHLQQVLLLNSSWSSPLTSSGSFLSPPAGLYSQLQQSSSLTSGSPPLLSPSGPHLHQVLLSPPAVLPSHLKKSSPLISSMSSTLTSGRPSPSLQAPHRQFRQANPQAIRSLGVLLWFWSYYPIEYFSFPFLAFSKFLVVLPLSLPFVSFAR
jgi:hypothetical protein